MSSKSKKPHRTASTSQLIRAALTMFLWAYCDLHDPTQEQMEEMSRRIQSVQEGVMTGRLKLRDIESALYEERGWRIL